MPITHKEFGVLPDQNKAMLYTLKSEGGLEADISNYGGAITALRAPDKDGVLADVVLGYDTLEEYMDDTAFFGTIIGRFANRIARGRFSLEGVDYKLEQNNGPNHLHGGSDGFNRQLWDAATLEHKEGQTLMLRRLSPHMEAGYPGELDVRVSYTLTPENELRIDYEAVTDRPTVLTLTNHTYFNLGGHDSGDCLAHEMTLHAPRFLATDADSIPLGEQRNVKGAPMDFLHPHPIGQRIEAPCDQLTLAKGYDHFYVLDPLAEQAGLVLDPVSGRVMTFTTTQPGVQFYSGNYIPENFRGKNGALYGARSGFCLETQGYPDAPNQPGFPTAALFPGELYKHSTVYAFTAV